MTSLLLACRLLHSLLDQRLVYEVVFMVTADLQQTLDGVMLQLCNESDHHDEDFRGRAKVSSMVGHFSSAVVAAMQSLPRSSWCVALLHSTPCCWYNSTTWP